MFSLLLCSLVPWTTGNGLAPLLPVYATPVSYTHLRAHETNDLISYAVFCL